VDGTVTAGRKGLPYDWHSVLAEHHRSLHADDVPGTAGRTVEGAPAPLAEAVA
jgi:hypothetical protein